eukprot:SAG11_NODE_104_length_16539_cov_8.526642_6_plen_90_part_00
MTEDDLLHCLPPDSDSGSLGIMKAVIEKGHAFPPVAVIEKGHAFHPHGKFVCVCHPRFPLAYPARRAPGSLSHAARHRAGRGRAELSRR